MKIKMLQLAVCLLCLQGTAGAEMFNNPSQNVGKKNLFVGLEYATTDHEYELDTNTAVPISSERISLKVTAGLADWLDLYVKGGGADMTQDYKDTNANVVSNYESDKSAGIGLGGRMRLLNFEDSRTRLFLTAAAYYFKTDSQYETYNSSVDREIVYRDMRWLDLSFGAGIAKRIDFVDLNAGVGFHEVKWWMKDRIERVQGNASSFIRKDWRDSFEMQDPVFGFIGIDFILPNAYVFSAQAGITDIDQTQFNVSISQGLRRD